MFERFTDRARKVMALANQEALRLNHEYVGTQHILLGLVKEGSGVGATVLLNLDVDVKKLRIETEKLIKPGPESVAMGKLPQTSRAKEAIEHAIMEARELNHNYLGTEHILLGLLREVDGTAAQILMNLGLKLEDVRQEVLQLLGVDIEDYEDDEEMINEGGETLVRKVIEEAARDGREELDLSSRRMKSLPGTIGQLANLRELQLGGNELMELPPALGQLANLQGLYVAGNQLTRLPAELGQLANLENLAVGQNQLTELPPELGQLAKLRQLGVGGNKLRELPAELGQLRNLEMLVVGGNPLESPPLDVVERGTEAVLGYLREELERRGSEDGAGSTESELGMADAFLDFLDQKGYPRKAIGRDVRVTIGGRKRGIRLDLRVISPTTGRVLAIVAFSKNNRDARRRASRRLAKVKGAFEQPEKIHGYVVCRDLWEYGFDIYEEVELKPPRRVSLEDFPTFRILAGEEEDRGEGYSGDEGEYHAPIAAFSGDGVRDAEGRLVDQLDIEAEVNAMSSLIAARDIKWPLSIGLFGDWGSGKSFFMEMMYDRIKKISGESDRWVEAGNKSDYCRNVVQIRFNAWHYMDSNLWASLVTHIFDELAKEVSSREKVDVEETRKVLFENLESAKKLKDEAEEHEKKAANLKQSAESKLTTVEQERAVAENELKRFTAKDVVALAKDDPRIQEQCRQIADKFGLEGIGAEVENIREVVEDAKKIFGGVMLILKGIAAQRRGRFKLIGLTMLLLGLPVLVGFVIFKVLPSGWMEQLGGMVFGFVTFLGIHAKTLRPRLNQVSKGLAQWEKTQEQILNIGSEKTRAEIELREEIKALKEQENRARQEVEAAEKCVQRAKEELDEIRTGRRLQRLIEEGSRKSEYLEKLGIIAVIRKDFEDLKNLVSESSEQVKSKEFPRIDRIVLYVDDLDRCPSKRVVEVLQAVHLILGFDLFVVVVAVDPRWILHALREEYSAFGGVDEVRARLGRRWLTTPQNYVEKIFQIPFALLRMGDRGYRQLVGKLVESEGRKDRETMGKEQEVMEREGREEQELEREIPQREEKEFRVDEFKPTIEMRPPLANLSAEEVKFMKAMGDLIPSPRAAKRFVNIYRLTLSSVNDGGKLSRLRGTENEPGDYQAVLLMLAILTGFPDQGSEVLKALEDGSETFTGVSDFVKKLKTQEEPNSEPARYHNGVRKGILEAERAVWDRLSKILKERIEELGVRDSLEPFVRWAGWVARFSFQYKPVISEEEGGEEDG